MSMLFGCLLNCQNDYQYLANLSRRRILAAKGRILQSALRAFTISFPNISFFRSSTLIESRMDSDYTGLALVGFLLHRRSQQTDILGVGVRPLDQRSQVFLDPTQHPAVKDFGMAAHGPSQTAIREDGAQDHDQKLPFRHQRVHHISLPQFSPTALAICCGSVIQLFPDGVWRWVK